jgi:glycosidase
VEWVDLRWAFGRWWRCELPPQPAGTIVRYRLEAFSSLGGEGVWADGGARFAYLVDDAAPPAWARDAIIYHIFVDRFYPGANRAWLTPTQPNGWYGGTLQGVIDKLDYIADLGVTTIWLSPIFDSPSYHGYDATDYYSVNPRYGTNDILKRLVQEAHLRGLRVLLDFVPNHCSKQHPFFLAAQRDRKSPYYRWFTFTQWPTEYASFFDVKNMPQWNLDYPPARAYMIEAACHWLTEYGVDGYRLDYALGPSHDFWTDFRHATRRAAPDSFTIAEAVESPEVMRTYAGRIDGCLDFPLAQVMRQVFGDDSLDVAHLDAFLAHRSAYFPANLILGTFLDNHDMNRFLWLAKGDARRLRLAALCQFTLGSPPIIYYGTEVGLSQTGDVRGPHGNAFHHHARQPMLWGDAQDSSLLAYYRRLSALRREHPAIREGERMILHLDAVAGTYAYACTSVHPRARQDTVLVALNTSSLPATLFLPVARSDVPSSSTAMEAGLSLPDGTELVDVLGGGRVVVAGGRVTITLAPRSGAALVHS